jgi:serine/threonine-protein kinase
VVERDVMRIVSRVLNSGCTPDEACKDTPELLAEVREQLRRIRSLDLELKALFPGMGASPEPSRSIEELPQVPGHEVLSVLGYGGMGVVYEARHVPLNRTVAVKMLLRGAQADLASLKRFKREAEAVAALCHPNIVQVHEVGDHDGLPYFTMEFVEGGSLSQRLAQNPLDAREAAALVSTLAQAMQAAHRSGIVHRDLKPANVLLTADGVPKIADFGLARRIGGESSLTFADARPGTPSYMAPEQVRDGSHAVGPAADVYALGAILYETLTGRPPFWSEVSVETLRQVVEDEPVRPSRSNPRVPRDLETICLKCLSKDPLRRYVSAAALAADLDRFLHGEPILAKPVGALERTWKWMRRRPAHATIAAGAVLAVLSLAGAGLWLSTQRRAIEQAVAADLAEVDRAAAAENWVGARTALERAKARLATADFGELRGLVEQGVGELAVVDELDAIRLKQVPTGRRKVDPAFATPNVDAAYQAAFLQLGLGDVAGHAEEVAARVRRSRIRSVLVGGLDIWAICVQSDPARRDQVLAVVRPADPDPTGWRDRVRDPATWNDKQALAELASTARIAAESVTLLLVLAQHLLDAGADAMPLLTRIQQDHPSDFWSNYTLGQVLANGGAAEAAIRYLQAAVSVRPDSAFARGNLGGALGATGHVDEAVGQLRLAVRIDPTLAFAHANLGRCFFIQREYAPAVESFRTAMRLDPTVATTWLRSALGKSLLELGRLDECIEVCREAVRLEPRSESACYSLGYALHAAGLVDEASEQLRRAIALAPSCRAYESLGHVLKGMARTAEAIDNFRQAVRLKPSYHPPRRALIDALLTQGLWEEASAEASLLLQSCPEGDPDLSSARDLAEHCALVAALDASLPAILSGTRLPANGAECLAFADLFRGRQDHAKAAGYFADAFARDGGTQSGVQRTHDAARCAALAGTGDDAQVASDERKGWRARALAWLREELEALEATLAAGEPGSKANVLLNLVDWRTDPAFAGLRDAALLERLPEDEGAPWRSLWRDAGALTERARAGR